jgi:hypothetical protein
VDSEAGRDSEAGVASEGAFPRVELLLLPAGGVLSDEFRAGATSGVASDAGVGRSDGAGVVGSLISLTPRDRVTVSPGLV